MRIGLDHVALSVSKLDWYIEFFESIFHMQIVKEKGVKPFRKIWFDQGIQLIERVDQGNTGELCHHVALRVADRELTYAELEKKDCKKSDQGDNWYLVREELLLEIL